MIESTEHCDTGWYCVRTKPKIEHIAARNLRNFVHLDEVFCPRVRYEKATRRGRIWFVEALFPGYFFARFDLTTELRSVNATSGVSGVLRFADRYPQVGDSIVSGLRREFPEEANAIRIINEVIAAGDEILITGGVMKGLTTIVTRILSGGDRVAVLLDWLGEEREAEVSMRAVSRAGDIRERIRRI